MIAGRKDGRQSCNPTGRQEVVGKQTGGLKGRQKEVQIKQADRE